MTFRSSEHPTSQSLIYLAPGAERSCALRRAPASPAILQRSIAVSVRAVPHAPPSSACPYTIIRHTCLLQAIVRRQITERKDGNRDTRPTLGTAKVSAMTDT